MLAGMSDCMKLLAKSVQSYNIVASVSIDCNYTLFVIYGIVL